ncbi:MAG: hypothetical protein E6R03_04845 [Hyphomicrobiaceae bacterium]|nr:MAG: hypothetical protein E6R03_04845 [Hyphomicrobiaceae bacterium]
MVDFTADRQREDLPRRRSQRDVLRAGCRCRRLSIHGRRKQPRRARGSVYGRALGRRFGGATAAEARRSDAPETARARQAERTGRSHGRDIRLRKRRRRSAGGRSCGARPA